MPNNKKQNKSSKGQVNLTKRPASQPMQALPQHRSAPAALGSKQISSSFRLAAGPAKYSGSIKVIGCDFLGHIASNAGTIAGTNLANIWLNPTDTKFNGTRLFLFGQMYDKYVFRRVKFHVLSNMGSNAAGSVLSAFDKDVGDQTPPATAQGLQQYFTMLDCVRAMVWENHTLDVKITDPQDFYYTNYLPATGDMRLAYQGQYYLSQVATNDVNESFEIWIEYEVDFFDPQLEFSTPEVVANSGSQTPSTAAGAAWNGLNPVGSVNILPFKIDTNGNKYFEVPAGTWALSQMISGATNAGGIPNPVISAIQSTLQPQVQRRLLDTFNATASGGAFRMDLLTIPAGGAKVFGDLSTWNTGVIAGMSTRIMQAGQGWN